MEGERADGCTVQLLRQEVESRDRLIAAQERLIGNYEKLEKSYGLLLDIIFDALGGARPRSLSEIERIKNSPMAESRSHEAQ
jgi:hypothetical protein